MAPIASKLCQNAFRTIPDISFFNVENLFETSNGRLPPEDGSDRPQTLGKRVSGDPRHFIFRRHKHFLRPSFLLQKIVRQRSTIFSAKCLFWRSCEGLDVTSRCGRKINCPKYKFQPCTTLGGGVKEVVCVFDVSFGEKKLIPSSL